MKSGKKQTKTETFLFVFTLLFLSLALGLNAYWTARDDDAAYTVTASRTLPSAEQSDASDLEEDEPDEPITPEYPLNLNSATARDLQLLPGIGETLAERIIAYRTAHGAFSSPEDLMKVDGIGEKKYEALADLVTVEEDTT